MTYRDQYSDAVLESMQSAYGEGFLSPGGAGEVADIVAGLSLEGRDVLDLGCGVGGASLVLARDLGAGSVLGIDLEERSIARARDLAAAAGLDGQVTFQRVEPGPIPGPAERFDLVFSKDVICHVPDKRGFLAETFRVLRPGGVFACGDWIKAPPGPGSAAFEAWAELLGASGLSFRFEGEEVYLGALEAAGFQDIELRDHSAWSEQEARRQLEHVTGPGRAALRAALGEAGLEARARQTRVRLEALASGGLRHCHLRAVKPAA